MTVDGAPATLKRISRIEHSWARCTLSPGRVQLVAQYRAAPDRRHATGDRDSVRR